MAAAPEVNLPEGSSDETALLLAWLGYLRGAVLRNVEDLGDEEARWTPDGKLVSLLGIVNHLTHVEWRWIDGGMQGRPVSRSEEEFAPGSGLSLAHAVDAYRARARATDTAVRAASSLDDPCRLVDGTDLRWVLLHLINETARHAGHADATRELLDGRTGE